MKLTFEQIAEKIDGYLKRFEVDPKINSYPPAHPSRIRASQKPYYGARAWYYRGSRMGVVYISFQGVTHLTRLQAERYLACLDKGFVGRHFEAFRPKVR